MVCSACVDDLDLKRHIRDAKRRERCSFCGSRAAPTAPLKDVAEIISDRLKTFYGKAADQLPYESAEGGYIGWHVDTYDLLFDTLELGLPRDTGGTLAQAIVELVGDDTWCEYDWLDLEYDDGLISEWQGFCQTVKHGRRFFFHDLGKSDPSAHGEKSFREFLADVCRLADDLGLIRSYPARYKVYRAREREFRGRYQTAAALGPPPAEFAVQSNRMNPPGIPMFYGSETKRLACAEVRSRFVSLGAFLTNRRIKVLNLHALRPVPGFFSSASRIERLGLAFLHNFAQEISKPVPRNDRTNVDYTPTQVFTEFVRDFQFEGGLVDGIRFSSATGIPGANLTLFATQAEIVDGSITSPHSTPWLELAAVTHSNVRARAATASGAKHK